MITAIRRMSVQEFLIAEAPSLIVALVIAELFYEFHSFILEALAFLATWTIVGGLLRFLVPKRANRPDDRS